MYRIEVEHLCARNKNGTKKTYEQMFYHVPARRSQTVQVERTRGRSGTILGFPDLWNPWCQAGLKRNADYRVQGSIKGFPDKGEIGLFPADGGVWKLEATRNVAGYFEKELHNLIEAGRVVVIR